VKISFSKTFEKSFSKYDHTLQKRIYDAIVKLPEGDVVRRSAILVIENFLKGLKFK